jgi:RNA 3'-terminal phosphate cyclase
VEHVAYYYPRDKYGKALGHSIAVIVKDNRVFFGFANLSKKDTFDRKIGRQIAESRARQQLNKFESKRRSGLPK